MNGQQSDMFPDKELIAMTCGHLNQRITYIQDRIIPSLKSLDMPFTLQAYQYLLENLKDEHKRMKEKLNKLEQDDSK